MTSNREPIEWLALMADPLLAQSVIDRLQSAAPNSSSTASPTGNGKSPASTPATTPDLTHNHQAAHHHDADADEPEVVPSHWQTGGPITLAATRCQNWAASMARRIGLSVADRVSDWFAGTYGQPHSQFCRIALPGEPCMSGGHDQGNHHHDSAGQEGQPRVAAARHASNALKLRGVMSEQEPDDEMLSLLQAELKYGVSTRKLARDLSLGIVTGRKVRGAHGKEWRVSSRVLIEAGYLPRRTDPVLDASHGGGLLSTIRALEQAVSFSRDELAATRQELGCTAMEIGRLKAENTRLQSLLEESRQPKL